MNISPPFKQRLYNGYRSKTDVTTQYVALEPLRLMCQWQTVAQVKKKIFGIGSSHTPSIHLYPVPPEANPIIVSLRIEILSPRQTINI